MHFGWIIEDESKSRLMDMAPETQRYIYEYDDVFLEADNVQGPLPLDEPGTMEAAAADILRGLHIKLPATQFVDGVITGTEEFYAPCFTLFTSYQLNKNLPSEEDIERIRKEFKFEGKPGWWPAYDFSWIP
ncbi:hypothetical protein EIP86_005186 [Pleurotus ostreatoroseus]|nr:hypothetical protein EIP86_005186 [Pleurotus ostreatoroseus]